MNLILPHIDRDEAEIVKLKTPKELADFLSKVTINEHSFQIKGISEIKCRKIEFPDGSLYEGEMLGDKFEGNGTIIFNGVRNLFLFILFPQSTKANKEKLPGNFD